MPAGGCNPTAGDTVAHESDQAQIVGRGEFERKRFATLASRAALAGHQFTRTHSGYLLARGAHSRHFADLDAAEVLIRRLEVGQSCWRTPADPAIRPAPPTSPAKLRALAAILAAHPGASSPAQCRRIREALAQFPLTTFEAMRYLDCYDPRARVLQLRNAGEAITTHWGIVTTEAGERHRVGVYALAGAEVTP